MKLLLLAAAVSGGCAAKRAAVVDDAPPPPAPVQVARPKTAEALRTGDDGAELARALEGGAVYFELDSARLSPEGIEALNRLGEGLRRDKEVRVTIQGHTCDLGTSEYNLALGQQRANVVRQYLDKLGVDPNRISVISYGEEHPAATGDHEGARTKNRRAELVVAEQRPRAAR